MRPAPKVEDIVKLAVGEKELSKFEATNFTSWESILAELITGDSFGVDRIDYLLRDSYHSGVAYGKFDHYRLIDTLRILPKKIQFTENESDSPDESSEDQTTDAMLGIDEGGIHSAEALLLARYFMYTQLYFHHVRRIYDIHLKEFLKAWLPGGTFPPSYEEILEITDNEVTAGFLAAARAPDEPGHSAAKRLVERDHLRLLYKRNPDDLKINPEASKIIYEAVRSKYGQDLVAFDEYPAKKSPKIAASLPRFPVLKLDGRIVWSDEESAILNDKFPVPIVGNVYVDRKKLDAAQKWLTKNRMELLLRKMEEDV